MNFQSAGRAHKIDKEKENENADTGKGMKPVNGMYSIFSLSYEKTRISGFCSSPEMALKEESCFGG